MKTETPSVKIVAITADEAGQRIDNFLRTQLKGVPKSMIYRILRKGEVRVNKKRIKPEYKLEAGDEVRIPPVRVAEREEEAVSPHLQKVAALADVILYEDDHILVLNKPSGTAVHGGSGFTQVVQRNRGDAILLNIDLHIEGLVAEGDRGSIDTGDVACIFSGNGGLSRRFLRRIILPGAEHDQKHHKQNNGEREKNSGVNHFFHM